MPLAPWPRTHFAPGGDAARVTLFAFSPDPLPDRLPLSRVRHGVPDGGPPPELSIVTTTRDAAPEWYHGFFDGASGAMARRVFGKAYPALERTAHCHRIELELPDPPDLGYLQSAWALARCVCEIGSVAVLDAAATRWLAAADVLAWATDRPFAIDREVVFVFETDPTPGVGHVAHTRGMAKFGRSDLVLTDADPGDVTGVVAVLESLALEGAMGRLLRAGQVYRVGAARARLAPYVPGRDFPDLHLNNAGLIVELE